MKPRLPYRYLIALGSNRRTIGAASPERVLAAALGVLTESFADVISSPIISSRPIGPSSRRYANAAALLSSKCEPTELLKDLQGIERQFGRRRGRRWGERTLDLDIILWTGGVCRTRPLMIPHKAFRSRAFVLIPATTIAPEWRDPLTRRSLRQLTAQYKRPKPLDPGPDPL